MEGRTFLVILLNVAIRAIPAFSQLRLLLRGKRDLGIIAGQYFKTELVVSHMLRKYNLLLCHSTLAARMRPAFRL